MNFDAKQFYIDYSVEYKTEGHKHTRPGWIQVECPFCTGNPGYHLGFNLIKNYHACYRCGFHPILEVVRTLSGSSWSVAKEIVKQYKTHSPRIENRHEIKHAKTVKLPWNHGKLTGPAISYLRRRKFNPYLLMDRWGIVSSGPSGGYKHRILIPITFGRTLVSYQGRDITGKSVLRYKACKKEDEVLDHKSVLYGLDEAKGRDTCVFVEGVTDAWRMGVGAVAGFGIEVKTSQLILIAENFQRCFVMFDDDPQAIKKANTVANNLSAFGLEVEICRIDGDPGDLQQEEADEYMAELFS